MIEIYCDKCGYRITLFNEHITVIDHSNERQYQLCLNCGKKAVKPITKQEIIENLLKSLYKKEI